VIEGALVGGVKPGNGLGDFVVGVGNGFEDALAEILRFVAIAKLECFVFTSEAPEGTAARPSAPPSRMTSASTVGLPRESMTWRARTRVILVGMSAWSPRSW